MSGMAIDRSKRRTPSKLGSPKWRAAMEPSWAKFRARLRPPTASERTASAAKRKAERLAREATLRARASAAMEPVEDAQARALLLEFLNKV